MRLTGAKLTGLSRVSWLCRTGAGQGQAALCAGSVPWLKLLQIRVAVW